MLVDDERIVEAMRLLFQEARVVTELAGAVGVAALLAHPKDFCDLRVATVICGSNITDDDARRWLY